MMRGKHIRMTIALIAFLVFPVAAHAQLPPPVEVLPAGFKVVNETPGPTLHIIAAKKPNENMPENYKEIDIKLQISWMKSPIAGQMLDILARNPEKPAGEAGFGRREEPCGKQRYSGGILTCRKLFAPMAGNNGLVTWQILWQGNQGSDGLVTIEVGDFNGSKETAMGWIDSIIPKITKGKK